MHFVAVCRVCCVAMESLYHLAVMGCYSQISRRPQTLKNSITLNLLLKTLDECEITRQYKQIAVCVSVSSLIPLEATERLHHTLI